MTETSYSHCVNLDNLRQATALDGFAVGADSLDDGQVMIRVDKVALTSNSISYVLAGKAGLIRYLDLFPAPEGRGHIPCWGYGDVIYSKHPEVAVGERLYGFFPIASHLICSPGKAGKSGFTDITPCRQVVPPFYNEYSYARREPGYAPGFEETTMLFRPLFGTSFLMESYCEDNGFFDADRIIVSSASAKTSMGFGYLLRKHHAGRIKAVGLTSTRNRDFVIGLDCFEQVVTYDEIGTLETGGRSVFFDVAGNQDVTARVHRRLGDTITYSGSVGLTHWEAGAPPSSSPLPGARPVFWSGPDQVMALRERYGAGEMLARMQASMTDFMLAAHRWLRIVATEGSHAIAARVTSMLDGEVGADEGVILRP